MGFQFGSRDRGVVGYGVLGEGELGRTHNPSQTGGLLHFGSMREQPHQGEQPQHTWQAHQPHVASFPPGFIDSAVWEQVDNGEAGRGGD